MSALLRLRLCRTEGLAASQRLRLARATSRSWGSTSSLAATASCSARLRSTIHWCERMSWEIKPAIRNSQSGVQPGLAVEAWAGLVSTRRPGLGGGGLRWTWAHSSLLRGCDGCFVLWEQNSRNQPGRDGRDIRGRGAGLRPAGSRSLRLRVLRDPEFCGPPEEARSGRPEVQCRWPGYFTPPNAA